MPQKGENRSKLSRRDFARRTAIAAATTATIPAAFLSGAEEPKAGLGDQAEIESKIQEIFQRYGERFSEAQKADIRRLVREGQKPLDAMRKFPLGNADQPGNVLKLYPDPPGEDRLPPASQD